MNVHMEPKVKLLKAMNNNTTAPVLPSESMMNTTVKISFNLESDLVSALKEKAREQSYLQKKTITVSDLVRDALHERYGEKNEEKSSLDKSR